MSVSLNSANNDVVWVHKSVHDLIDRIGTCDSAGNFDGIVYTIDRCGKLYDCSVGSHRRVYPGIIWVIISSADNILNTINNEYNNSQFKTSQYLMTIWRCLTMRNLNDRLNELGYPNHITSLISSIKIT